MKRVLKLIIILLIIVSSFTLITYYNNQNTLSEQIGVDSNLDNVNNVNASDIDKRLEREILIRVGDQTFTAILHNNDSAKSIFDMLPFTLDMADMNLNEKFYYFDKSFPINSERVEKISYGDLMLYGSDCLVLFYESFSTMYTYTPLGYIENTNGLKEALGKGNVTVTFSAE